MVARIAIVAAAGLLAGLVSASLIRPAEACRCAGPRWVLEVRDGSRPSDRVWRGRFVLGERSLAPAGGTPIMTLVPQP